MLKRKTKTANYTYPARMILATALMIQSRSVPSSPPNRWLNTKRT